MSKDAFDASSAEGDFSVNYVWLCPRENGRAKDKPATRLPLHYFERMYENAAKYPDATFNLWLDFEQLSIADRYFLDSHRYLFDAGNVNICDLRTVPEYDQAPGFDLDSNIGLYARADYARILVLNHLLQGDHDHTIIYSDLDCEDVSLHQEEVGEKLSEYGMAFGWAATNKACNGYIALRGEEGRRFMDKYLMPRLKIAFQKNLINHYGAFAESIRRFQRQNHPTLTYKHWGVVALPNMRSVMPYDADMYQGVCGVRTARVPGSKDLV